MSNSDVYNKWTRFIEKYKEYFLSNDVIWRQNLQKVSNYIELNNKRPSHGDKNKDIKKLGQWISDQQKMCKIKSQIMSNAYIYDEWINFIEKYKEYFLSNDVIWRKNLQKVSNYIELNKKRPSYGDKNKDIKKLGQWIGDQQKKCKTKSHIMSNIYI